MTKKKSRTINPYTTNVSIVGLSGFTVPLITVLNRFVDEDQSSALCTRIHDAVTRYNRAMQTNPKRQVARRQSRDRDELIECMKELNARLNPVHIPLPLLDAASASYMQYECGTSTLNEEIVALLQRLQRVQQFFEAVSLPFATNPGKSERKELVRELESIFDSATESAYLPSGEDDPSPSTLHAAKRQDRKQFVRDVLVVFNLSPSPL